MKCPSASLRTVALSLSLLAACHSTASGPSSTSRDSAGVTIVENHGGDRPLDWKLQQIATIENGAVGGIQLSQLTEYTATPIPWVTSTSTTPGTASGFS